MAVPQTLKLISNDGFLTIVDETFIRESNLLRAFAASNTRIVRLNLSGSSIDSVIKMAYYVIYDKYGDVSTLQNNHAVLTFLGSLQQQQLQDLATAVDYLGIDRMSHCIMQLGINVTPDDAVNQIAANLGSWHI